MNAVATSFSSYTLHPSALNGFEVTLSPELPNPGAVETANRSLEELDLLFEEHGN